MQGMLAYSFYFDFCRQHVFFLNRIRRTVILLNERANSVITILFCNKVPLLLVKSQEVGSESKKKEEIVEITKIQNDKIFWWRWYSVCWKDPLESISL